MENILKELDIYHADINIKYYKDLLSIIDEYLKPLPFIKEIQSIRQKCRSAKWPFRPYFFYKYFKVRLDFFDINNNNHLRFRINSNIWHEAYKYKLPFAERSCNYTHHGYGVKYWYEGTMKKYLIDGKEQEFYLRV